MNGRRLRPRYVTRHGRDSRPMWVQHLQAEAEAKRARRRARNLHTQGGAR
jgi:hypothetical protein